MKPIIATLLLLLGGVSLLAQSYYLDQSFGDGGIAQTSPTNVIINDNKMRIICSGAGNITRYNPDGSLDETFGIKGSVTIEHSCFAIFIFSDNKILTLSPVKEDGKGNSYITKYNENGTLDDSFGEGGVLVEEGYSPISSAAIRTFPNGQFLINAMYSKTDGFTIFKYNADGTLDSSFGSDGKVTWSDIGVETPYEHSCCVLEDNSIVLGGFVDSRINWKFAVVKLNPNGSVANEFGNEGVLIIDFALSPSVGEIEPVFEFDSCRFLKEIGNGQFVAGGVTDNSDTFILKINADGSLDKTFGDDGVVFFNYSVTDIDIDFINNRIIAGGHRIELPNKEFGMYYPYAQFDMDGNLISSESVDFSRKIFLRHRFIQPNGKWLLGDSYGALVMLTSGFISAEDASTGNFTISPNPAGEVVTVSHPSEVIREVALYDNAGRQLLVRQSESSSLQLALPYPAGIYHLSITTASGKQYNQKVVRE